MEGCAGFTGRALTVEDRRRASLRTERGLLNAKACADGGTRIRMAW
jgi:hypothetical protein